MKEKQKSKSKVKEKENPAGKAKVEKKEKSGNFLTKLKSKLPVFKFLLIFGSILAIYFIFINSDLRNILNPYFHLTAKIVRVFVSIFVSQTTASGTIISSPGFSMSVGFGCEGFDPLAIFIAVIIALPLNFKLKLPGLLIGIPFLLILNLFRLMLLFFIGLGWHSVFEAFHLTIFPILFIIIVLIMLFFWQKWVLSKKRMADA
ncbi:MAG: rane protein of unknown function [Ignavibacteria bacterium]|nr:rane protein of unknown function [Ignavibacteria bacterium]